MMNQDKGGALVERPPSFFDYSLNGIAGTWGVLDSGINLSDYVPGVCGALDPLYVFDSLLRCPYCSYSIWPEPENVNRRGEKNPQCFQEVRKKINFLFSIKSNTYRKFFGCVACVCLL